MHFLNETCTNKNLKRFAAMEKADNRAAAAWAKLYKVETKWEALKEKLQKEGIWNEYCDRKGWCHTASFHDIGA